MCWDRLIEADTAAPVDRAADERSKRDDDRLFAYLMAPLDSRPSKDVARASSS